MARFKCPKCGGAKIEVAVMVDPNGVPLAIPTRIVGDDIAYCQNPKCGESDDLWTFDTWPTQPESGLSGENSAYDDVR